MQKKSILFIADKPDWAYHNIIKTWANYLKGEYDCYVAFSEDYLINFKQFSSIEKIISNTINPFRGKEKFLKIDDSKKYSYPVYKKPPVYEVLSHQKIEKSDFGFQVEMAYYFQYIAKFPFSFNKNLIGIYTDSFPHEGPSFDAIKNVDLKNLNRTEFFNQYLKPYDGLIVGNTNLFDDYKDFLGKIVFANGIFKQNEFLENKNVGENEILKIGWTGNPTRSMKGFNEVIMPAIEEVKKTGRKIELKTQFSGSYETLLSFYTNIDLILIASEADTGPSLFSEASLCNIPSITTEIGFPKMVVKDGKNGIFVNRNITEMKNAIVKLYDDRALLKSFSKRIKNDYLAVLDNEISAKNLKTFLNKI